MIGLGPAGRACVVRSSVVPVFIFSARGWAGRVGSNIFQANRCLVGCIAVIFMNGLAAEMSNS